MGNRRQQPESFADLVGKARSTPREEETYPQRWPQPIRDRHWTDDSGTRWHLRGVGGGLIWPEVRRLLTLPDLRVLHAYGLHPREVVGADRDALMERVEEFFAGEAPPNSEFWLAEFRDDERHVMLVVEESC